jgi:hypothetical protein
MMPVVMLRAMKNLYQLLGRPPLTALVAAVALPLLVGCALVSNAQSAEARGPATFLRNAELITGAPNHPDVLTGCAYGQRVWILDNGSHGDRGGIAVNADPTCGPDGPIPVP